MKETKIFTFNNAEQANEFLDFIRENEIPFEATKRCYDYLNTKFVFECEMDETEARIAETLINREDNLKGQLSSKTVFEKLFWNHNPDEPFIKLNSNKKAIPELKELVFNDPATIIFWEDGTKTIVKTQNGEPFDKEKGFCMAVVKKLFGNEGNYYNIVDEWINKKAKIYDDSSKKKSNKASDHKNEITKKE